MKRKICLLFTLVLLLSTCVTGCSESITQMGDVTYNERTGEMYVESTEGKERIKISYIMGCGLDWAPGIGAEFLQIYGDEYYLLLEPDSGLASSLKTTLEAGITETLSDIYFAQNDTWQTWAAFGWMEPLDEVYASTEFDEVPLSERMEENTYLASSRYAAGGAEHYYVVPWNDIVTGIVYNKTLFDDYGWEVPTTVSELKTLCDQILEDTDGEVAPFVYPGLAGGYFDNVCCAWWIQSCGAEAYDDYFALDSSALFDPAQQPSLGKLKMLETFEDFFGTDAAEYSLSGSLSTSNISAQISLLRENAAMMPNGNWFEAEMKDDLAEFDLDFRMMQLPFIDNALTDKNGDPIYVNYGVIPEVMFVPSKAPNKEGAKKFLAFFNSTAMCRRYTEINGLFRPVEYSIEGIQLSDFAASAAEIRDRSVTVIDNPRGNYFVNSEIRKYNLNGSPFLRIVRGEITPAQYCKEEYEYVAGLGV